MHRPYHYWMRYRYNGIFHTVACTGMYLVMVSGAIIGKLYGKWKNSKKLLLSGRTELFLLAAVVTNILLSMSRTAILTFIVNILLVMILAAVSYRKTWKHVITELCLIVAVIATSFPMMYSIMRVVPSMVNEPVRYEIEPQDRYFMLYEGDKVDSDKYMTIRRYFEVFFGRFDSGEEVQSRKEDTMLVAYVSNEVLPVDYSAVGAGSEATEEHTDMSNGRFDIFKDYMKNITLGGHEKMALEISEMETRLDNYEDQLGTYMVKLSSTGVSDSDSKKIAKILHTINDFERIGDHAVNIAEWVEFSITGQHTKEE